MWLINRLCLFLICWELVVVQLSREVEGGTWPKKLGI